ncbi:thioester domain-containing protein [Georgenia satyanarayanai]|uniref:thioester domain-containing protein n=1 Tax=Georgenia satyanarayanai TaxID=860221 RepID=UPI001264EE9F|nr:thioester domain-containing protein [Georgenia satyanarayanai]
MKNASRRAPGGAAGHWLALVATAVVALMTLAPATAYADTATDDAFSIGAAHQAQEGEGIARLFPVFTNEESRTSGEPDVWAYCIEYTVPARFDTEAEAAGWSEFRGDNNFSTSQEVQEKVAWIITNSYPRLSLEQLGEVVGIPDLSVSEAVGGTQYAIWALTDDVAADLSPDARTVRDYLLGEANTGLAESDVRAEVSLTASTEQTNAGALVGPVTVSTTQASVSLTVSSSLPVVDADGAEIDLSTVVNGQQLYVDAREETVAGSATFTATATASRVTGSILNVPGAAGAAADHAQTIILVDTEGVSDVASATLSWSGLPDEPVAPVLPEVTQAVCTDEGDTTTPSITPSATEGVEYSFDEDAVQPGRTVEVTATAQEGYTLTAAEGWTLHDDGESATTTVELAAVDCAPVPVPEVPVAPTAPEVTQAVCTDEGDTTTPSITPSATEGVEYSFDEDAVQPGRTVEVTATAQEGYTLTAAEGWTLHDDGESATTTVELAAADCAVASDDGPGERAPETSPGVRLPSTGTSAAALLGVVGLLLAGGVAAVLHHRRRSPTA